MYFNFSKDDIIRPERAEHDENVYMPAKGSFCTKDDIIPSGRAEHDENVYSIYTR